MEDGPRGASSGAIHGTSLQMANINTLVANVSPVMRTQNLEGLRKTQQVTIVVRHQNMTTWGVVEEGRTSHQNKMVEEWELEVFESFKNFSATNNMRRL